MRIGQLAAQTGLNVQTIRFYEQRGLLKAPRRAPSGYRDYPTSAEQIIRFIRSSQRLGYSLKEIGELLRLREQRDGNAAQVRAIATARLRRINEQIRELRKMRREMKRILDACSCDEISQPRCPVLEQLDHCVIAD